MQIKKASINDMDEVVNLLKIILDEMELPFYLNNDKKEVTKLFVETFKSKNYQKNADILVAKVDNQVAGVAFGYPGKNEDLLDDEYQKHFDTVKLPAQEVFEDEECDEDEWYLDSLAVNPDFQNQGIGTKLLKAIPDYAKERNLSTIGLLVDEENPNAERLYRRMGFEFDHEQVVSNHQYKHLKKEVI